MKSILLVDDEETVGAELQRTLQGFGFHVEVTRSVEAALSLVRGIGFDLILVEFNLRSEHRAHPTAGNGLKLVRQLRSWQVMVPILVFTAMEGEMYEKASLDGGADDFILKTTPIPCLVSRLRAQMRRYERSLLNRRAFGLNKDICNPPDE
jgi:DNA-binding response OmpR family regulator